MFETRDPDELMETVAQAMVPPNVDKRGTGKFASQLQLANLGPVGTMIISIRNADVLLAPGSGQYFLNVPIGGTFETDQGMFSAAPLPDRADITAPGRPFHLKTDSTTCLVFRFDDDWRQDLNSRLADGQPSTKSECDGVLDTRAPLGRQIMHGANLIWSDIRSDGLTGEHRTAATQELATDLLLAMRGAGTTTKPPHDPTPAALDNLVDWIHDNLCGPISRADLCDVSGLHVGTLTRGMQQRFGVSPMQYIREQRLDAIRQVLLRSCPEETSVTRVAEDFSVGHLGRFAHAYRQRFNERASDTLRR